MQQRYRMGPSLSYDGPMLKHVFVAVHLADVPGGNHMTHSNCQMTNGRAKITCIINDNKMSQ